MGRLRESTEDVDGSIRIGRRPLLQGPAAADLGSTQWWAILHSRVSPYRHQLLQGAERRGRERECSSDGNRGWWLRIARASSTW